MLVPPFDECTQAAALSLGEPAPRTVFEREAPRRQMHTASKAIPPYRECYRNDIVHCAEVCRLEAWKLNNYATV